MNFADPAMETAFRESEWRDKLPMLRIATLTAIVVWPAFSIFDFLVAREMFAPLFAIRIIVTILFAVLIRFALRGPLQYEVCISLLSHTASVGLVFAALILDTPTALLYFTGIMITMFSTPILFHLPFRAVAVNTAVCYLIYLPIPLAHHLPAPVVMGHLMYITTFGALSLFGIWFFESSLRANYLSRKSLAESEERFRNLFTSASDMVYTHDLQGDFTSFNNACERILGYSAQEIIGQNVSKVVAPESVGKARESILAKLSGQGDSTRYELEVIPKDGSRRTIELSSSIILSQGKPVGIQSIARDMTESKRAREALRISEEKLRAYMEHISDAVRISTSDLTVSYASPGITRILGYSPEEAVGRSSAPNIHPDDLPAVHEALRHVLEYPGAYDTVEYRARHKDGHWVHVEVNSVNMIDNPAIGGILTTMRDITERRAVEEISPDIFYDIDLQGNLQRINLSAQKFFGLSREQLKGRSCIASIYEEDHPIVLRDIQKTLTVGSASGIYRFVRHDGTLVPFHCNSTLVCNSKGEPTGFLGFGRDISELQEKERLLHAAKDKAEAATKLKDKFVGLVSHDLRSPLGSIIGFLDIVRDDPEMDAGMRDSIMTRIRRSAGALLNLIDGLLNLNRLKTGSIRPSKSPLAARPMVDEIFTRTAPQAEQKGVSLLNDTPAGMRLMADTHLFHELLANLVSNAIKFTGKGKTITVFSPRPNVISVKDDGTGIKPEILPNLFRSDIKTTTVGTAGERGTGLGLPYCYDIVNAHGGELTVESELGKGSVFHVTLPLYDRVILLVDDQEAHRNIMKEQMNTFLKAEYIEAENGVQALDALAGLVPDLIVTDIEMAEMNGYDLIRNIRAMGPNGNTPILAVSSFQSSPGEADEVKQKAMSFGANDFAQKPLVAEEFIPCVKKLLGSSKSGPEQVV